MYQKRESLKIYANKNTDKVKIMAEKYSMKDDFYNPTTISKISSEIKIVYDDFAQHDFESEVLEKFPKLELKERMYHIRDMLSKYLPDDFKNAIKILLNALPSELDPNKSDDDFGDFIYAPYSEFVTEFGCTKEHLEFSLSALREITKRFSVEFAIRDFINAFPKETYEMMMACSLSENYHERRFASEGRRIKLPWAKKIDIDYRDNIQILDNLYLDNTRFVTRSVANHLNDLSKIDAPLVLTTLKGWRDSKRQNKKEMEFIINHALRSLIKSGNKETLEFLGYKTNPAIQIKDFSINKESIKIGEALEFDFEIMADKDEKLIVDYILYFRTKSGTQNPKVHKIKKLTLAENSSSQIMKKHTFKANMTTRKLYEGEHKVELQINGKVYESKIFELVL